MTETPTFHVRPARETDHPFLYSSFLKSFRESNLVEGVPNTAFFDTFKAEFARVLEHFTVLVAHPEGDDDEIAGWVAFKAHTVAWIYVKKEPWRRMGVARSLWAAADLPASVHAIYGSRWAMAFARMKDIDVQYCAHVDAALLLAGVA